MTQHSAQHAIGYLNRPLAADRDNHSPSVVICRPPGGTTWDQHEAMALLAKYLKSQNQEVETVTADLALDCRLPWTGVLPASLRHLGRLARTGRHILIPLVPGTNLANQLALPLLWSRFFGIRPIVDARHAMAEIDLERPSRLLQTMLRATGPVLVSNEALAARLRRYGIPVKSCPPVVDSDRFGPRLIESLQPRILSYLPADPQTEIGLSGWRAIMRSFDMVKSRYPRAEMLLLVDQPTRLLPSACRDLPVGVQISSASEKQVAGAYRWADVYVNPVTVGNPLSAIVHALASGLPVVTTQTGSAPEFVRENVNGLLVPPNHPVLIADRLAYLVAHSDVAHKLSAGAADSSGFPSTRQEWLTILDGPVR